MIKEDLNQVILFLIDQTSAAARRYSQKEFDLLEMGLTVEQWVLLKLVDQYESKTQSEIAILAQRDPAAITRSLDLLEKKGLIKRSGVKGNKRQKNVLLTKEGRYFIMQYMPLIQHMRNKGLKGFSRNEIVTLQNFLIRIRENYSKTSGKGHSN